MSFPIACVDAFTDRPFAGNPAGVCVLDRAQPEDWMQRVAAEMNLAETAFVTPQQSGWSIRWFTPIAEVDLCGHATLASAHVLWTSALVPPDAAIEFSSRSGVLSACRQGEEIELNFPAEPGSPVAAPALLLDALGAAAVEVERNRFDYLVQLGDEAAVRAVRPRHADLATLDCRGVIVTARAQPPYDFVSRFFASRLGIPEDPVTGSAHCFLGPYWAARLGRSALTGFQASARGGAVRVTVDGSRVRLGGRAVTVHSGQLLV